MPDRPRPTPPLPRSCAHLSSQAPARHEATRGRPCTTNTSQCPRERKEGRKKKRKKKARREVIRIQESTPRACEKAEAWNPSLCAARPTAARRILAAGSPGRTCCGDRGLKCAVRPPTRTQTHTKRTTTNHKHAPLENKPERRARQFTRAAPLYLTLHAAPAASLGGSPRRPCTDRGGAVCATACRLIASVAGRCAPRGQAHPQAEGRRHVRAASGARSACPAAAPRFSGQASPQAAAEQG